MNELMGDGYVEGKDTRKNSFNGVLDEYAEEVCFGRVWARSGIDRKLRSILNITMLTALNRPTQLRSHVEGGTQQRRHCRGVARDFSAHYRVLRSSRCGRRLPGRTGGAEEQRSA